MKQPFLELEREAWLHLAKLWSKPTKGVNDFVYANYSYGLCMSIGDMYREHKINDLIKRML